MKRALTYFLCGALLLAATGVSRCADPPKATVILRCVYIVVVSGTACLGAYAIKCISCALDHMFSNHNWLLTNTVENMPPLISLSTNTGTMTFQSATGIGSVWVNEFSVDLQKQDNQIVGILSRAGVPIATNAQPIVMDAQGDAYIRLDFSAYILPPQSGTNCPPVQFMRLSE